MLGEGREVAGNLAGKEALKNWSRNYGNLNNLPEEVCIRFCQWHVENKGFTSAVMSCSERNNSSPGFDTCEMAMPRSSTHVLFGASQWKNDREKWEQIQCRALLVRRHKEYLREICMFRGEGFGAPSEMHGDKVKSKIWNTGHSDYIWGMFFVWGSGFCFCFFYHRGCQSLERRLLILSRHIQNSTGQSHEPVLMSLPSAKMNSQGLSQPELFCVSVILFSLLK